MHQAARWLSEHGKRYDQIRIDAVGLLQEGTGGFTIEHIRTVGVMETARTRTATVIGVEGHMVEVEADIDAGLPATILAGLPDTGRPAPGLGPGARRDRQQRRALARV